MARNLKVVTNAGQKLDLVDPATVQSIRLADAGYGEQWLQEQLQKNSRLLELGHFLECRNPEALNGRGGHLDMIFQDRETETRYCVEVVLGDLDESDFLRVVEFWEEERSKHFNYRCIPVIVTEAVPTHLLTSFSARSIPLVVMRMNCLKREEEDQFVLQILPVLDYSQRRLTENPEPKWSTASRRNWLEICSPGATKAMDEWMDLCRKIEPALRVTYHQGHVALGSAQGHNFSWLYAEEEGEWVRLALYLNEADRRDAIAELDSLGIDWHLTSSQRLRINLRPGNVEEHRALFKRLVLAAVSASV